jgi:adenylylsulfate kinase
MATAKKNDWRPAVLWFTGLSGAGKSTIASGVVSELVARGIPTEYLDGDAVRLLSPTGFSRADRDAHVKRVGYLASRLEHHRITVVCALISPYAEARRYVRGLCARFVEIYVATPLPECERRDVKGLYARARRGEIAHFTGIDDPYEAPSDAELVIDTTAVSPALAVQGVLTAAGAVTSGPRGREARSDPASAFGPDRSGAMAAVPRVRRGVTAGAAEPTGGIFQPASRRRIDMRLVSERSARND